MNKIISELWDFFKRNFAVLAIGILFMIFYFGGCGRSGTGGTIIRDTVTTTTQVPQPIIVMPPYAPQQAGNTTYPIVIPSQYNPSQDMFKLTAQYSELVKQFLAVKNYEDSITLRDTAGRRVGVFNLKQTVSENTLKSTQPSYQLNFPHTTRTITNTVYPRAKNQIYVGMGIQSLMNKPTLQQVDLGLMLKNKKDNVLSLSGVYDLPTKQPGIRVGYYQKLTFKIF